MATPSQQSQEPDMMSSLHRGDSLRTSMIVLIVLAGAQRMVGLVRNVVFCDMLESEQLGRWSLSFNFLLLAAPLVVFGIPGSFGRYVEKYRQQGQLRAFMRRTVTVSGALTLITAIALIAFPQPIAWLLFGDPQQWHLVWWLAGTLSAVLMFNVVVELLTAMRLIRIVSLLQMVSSFGFAIIGVAMLYFTAMGEQAVIISYGVGSLIAAIVGALVLARFWRGLPKHERQLGQRDLWAQLMPFATWMWISNFIGNMFEAADQFMLKHFSNVDPVTADSMVGQYYSSRVVPLLLVSLAFMLGGSLLPHLIKDWEAGRRELVHQRLNQAVKLLSVTFTFGAAMVLLAAPLVFTWALRGKYDAGLAVLPGTLVYCLWYSMGAIANKYLLCAENTRIGSVAFGAGLVSNVALNFLLAPILGLVGVVIATAVANAIMLLLIYYLGWINGMRWDRGLIFTSLLPLALCLGGWQALAVAILACFVAYREGWLLDNSEQTQLTDGIQSMIQRGRTALGMSLPAST
ncbi:MAG: lipopolysaccharide biosynthesis protein [Planctomycetes bacterium]|nr:lipopolysaccharide biosynthesis protein [Planctomycetota bacterium]